MDAAITISSRGEEKVDFSGGSDTIIDNVFRDYDEAGLQGYNLLFNWDLNDNSGAHNLNSVYYNSRHRNNQCSGPSPYNDTGCK
ncbi:uncharacterized protein A4U43_C07F22160 [Asparagus officinalis]|uniref:Uncharacterized protein n=1 Tax=Asparagus officinalis TaxID=4686 RepID=A0A5P1EDZ2_ASPOF|nr:uncharacterized protein A4U43_C07F22160 [Asparagus officinalis]